MDVVVSCAKNIVLYGEIISSKKISFSDCCNLNTDGPPEEFTPAVKYCDTTVTVCGTSYNNFITDPPTEPIVNPVVNSKYVRLAIKDTLPITYDCLNWEDFNAEFEFDQVKIAVAKDSIFGYECKQVSESNCCPEEETLPTNCLGVALSGTAKVQISKLNSAAQSVLITPAVGYPASICCPTDVNVNPPPAKCHSISVGNLAWFPFIRNGGYTVEYTGNTTADPSGCVNYLFVESKGAITPGKMTFFFHEIATGTKTTNNYYLAPGFSYYTITTPNYVAFTGKVVSTLRVPCSMNIVDLGSAGIWYTSALAFACSGLCYDPGITGFDISNPDAGYWSFIWEFSQQFTYFAGDPWYGTYPPILPPPLDPDPARVGFCIHSNPFSLRYEICRQIEVQLSGSVSGDPDCCFETPDIPGDGVTPTRYGTVAIHGSLIRRVTGEREEDLLGGYPWDGTEVLVYDIKRTWNMWPGPATATSPIYQKIRTLDFLVYEDPAQPGYYRSTVQTITLMDDPNCDYPLTTDIKVEVMI